MRASPKVVLAATSLLLAITLPAQAQSDLTLTGPSTHAQSGNTLTFEYGEEYEGATLTLTGGEANRPAACQPAALAALFKGTQGNFGPMAPLGSFAQMKDELTRDRDHHTYAWFAPCEVKNQRVRGLLCVDPRWNGTGISLTRCTFTEGTAR